MPLPLTSASFPEVYKDPIAWDLNYGEAFYRYHSLRDDDQVRYDITNVTIEAELILADGEDPFVTFTITKADQTDETTKGDYDIELDRVSLDALEPGQTFGFVKVYYTFEGDVDRTLIYKADAVFKNYPAAQVGG